MKKTLYVKVKGLRTLQDRYADAYRLFVQPVTRGFERKSLCTAFRQVSRLIDHCIGHLPGCPVIWRRQLLNYGDEFVQDLHLFPFSSESIERK